MAVTGTGTQADPFIVHSYNEFISLSGHAPITDTRAVYIKFFDTPNQTIDCNDYGSEFKWGTFTAVSGYGGYTIYIDLNGCTIKNFLIADGSAMFAGTAWGGEQMIVSISNGAIRNVFMGSAASIICNDYVEFHDVSMSVNFVGCTFSPFSGGGSVIIDNSAIYLVGSVLSAPVMTGCVVSDTDMELHISNPNDQLIFRNCTITDCRIQGKISGNPHRQGNYPSFYFVLLAYNSNGVQTGDSVMTNCVVDIDLSEATPDWTGATIFIYYPENGATLNTNIFCNSHFPPNYGIPSDWNYISHTLMRNGAYLNSVGFTVVEVVGS